MPKHHGRIVLHSCFLSHQNMLKIGGLYSRRRVIKLMHLLSTGVGVVWKGRAIKMRISASLICTKPVVSRILRKYRKMLWIWWRVVKSFRWLFLSAILILFQTVMGITMFLNYRYTSSWDSKDICSASFQINSLLHY